MLALLDMAWWAPALIWAVVYATDFSATLMGARGYRRLAGRFLQFESYELTPFYKKTVERGRWLSPRFALLWVLSTSLAGWICWLSRTDPISKGFACFCLGAILLMEAMVHVRHVRNLTLFAMLQRGEGVEGTLRYPAWLSYSSSAVEAASFAVLFLVLAAADQSLFCLGGSVGTAALAVRHWRYGAAAHKKLRAAQSAEGGG